MAFARLLAALAAIQFFSFSALAFDPDLNSNLVVYWGQGPDQERLRYFCEDDTIDIIIIGFVNVFPEQGAGGYPGTNFGNQCWGYYENENGETTELLRYCEYIVQDIPICQARGKKIFLSLGGSTDRYKIQSTQAAIDFADFLWGTFGPETAGWEGPRPFGNSSVDGFDFDIEHNGPFGYSTMIDRFRYHFRRALPNKYYISAAPQCQIPDLNLGSVIRSSFFDFVFVQFYNTPGCSARDFLDEPFDNGFTLGGWIDIVKQSPNPSAKVLIGLPASTDAAPSGDGVFYLAPQEVFNLLVWHYPPPENFGGLMLWEATYSNNNQIDGRSFAHHVREHLDSLFPRPDPTTILPSL